MSLRDRIFAAGPMWGVVANGCHPNRHTLDAICAAGFDVSGVDQGELPGLPALVRAYVSGNALVRGEKAAPTV